MPRRLRKYSGRPMATPSRRPPPRRAGQAKDRCGPVRVRALGLLAEAGQVANTQFTSTPGFLAQAPAQNAPAVATAQNGQTVHTQPSHGTWLFPPHDGGGNNG